MTAAFAASGTYTIAINGSNWRVTAPDGTRVDTALAASTSQQITLVTPAAGTTILMAGIFVDTAFTGGAISGLTGNLGTDQSGTAYVSNFAMHSGLAPNPTMSGSISAVPGPCRSTYSLPSQLPGERSARWRQPHAVGRGQGIPRCLRHGVGRLPCSHALRNLLDGLHVGVLG